MISEKQFSDKPEFDGEWVRLGDVCSKGKSALRQKDLKNDGPYPVYGASGIVGFSSEYQNADAYVAVVKDGAGVGRVVACEPRSSVLGTMQALLPGEGTDRDYLLHLVRSLDLGKGFTGSTIPHIYFKDYGKTLVRALSGERQVEVASKLNGIDRLISQSEGQLFALDDLVKSQFIEMFGDPIHNEKGYPEQRLGELLDIARGGSPRPIKDYLTDDPRGINWIKIGDTAEGSRYINSTAEKIRPEGKAKSREVKAGDFLLSNSMSFGRPYILNIDGCIHDGWLVLSDNKKRFNKIFLCELLCSSALKAKFAASVRGGVVNNLNIDLVANTVVPYPPLTLQQEFADFVAEVDKLGFDKACREP